MIKLESGRTIDLESLKQEKTYAGLLEGMPRKDFNDRIIEGWRRQAVPYEGQKMALIDPVRRPGATGLPRRGDELWGPPEFLPAIVCVGMFQSTPVRNEREDFSLLIIVWFQEAFAMPIDPGVVAQIRKLDWETLAYNWTM